MSNPGQSSQQKQGGGGGGGGGKPRRRGPRKGGGRGGGGGGAGRGESGGKDGQEQQEEPQPPALTEEEQKALDDHRRQEEEKRLRDEEEARKLREIAEEKRRAEGAAAARKQQQRELEQSVFDAKELLKGLSATIELHAANREALKAENLASSRKEFTANKKKYKTDLKKCTAFVKKVKSGQAWSMRPADVTKDVTTLNLSRYVEEVVTAIVDSSKTSLKVPDLPTVTSLCFAMHQRYPEFLPGLLPTLWGIVLGKKTSGTPQETAKLRRLYTRLLTDFLLNGLITETKPFLKCTAEWTGASTDYKNLTDAPCIVAFGKGAGFEVFGITPASVQSAMELVEKEHARRQEHDQKEAAPTVEGEAPAEKAPDTTDVSLVSASLLEEAMTWAEKVHGVLGNRAVSSEVSEVLSQHCLGAYRTLATSLVQTHGKLQKLEKRCAQDRLLSGSLSDAREKGLADARKLTESLLKSVEALSDVLAQPVPVLVTEEDDTDAVTGTGVEVWTKGEGEDDFGPFDDEETYNFYCDIPDLLTTIPPALLGIPIEEIERRKEANAKRFGSDDDAAVQEEEEETAEVTPASKEQLDAEEAEEDGETARDDEKGAEGGEENKDAPHYKLTLLLEQELPECHSRLDIDEMTEKFCTNHGSSKNSRKRLQKTLFLVPHSRIDLLPYYSRMTATLDRVWTDIAPQLVIELEQQFHGQAKFKKNQNIESRMKTARYIGELTKFRVAPPIVPLRCLERCIEDFTGSNVDIACALLESCGRFLYRTQHTNAKIIKLMETMTRLSKAKNLDDRLQSILKAAFFNVKPPPTGPRKKVKEYPPLEAYLRDLLLVRLEPNPSSVSFVSKQILRLPWSDPSQQCGALVCKIMLKACVRGRYKAIEAIAAVASKLRTQRAAGEVTIRLIDAVIEELRWALEHPNFRDQQRVITYVRLLGELYCSSQVSGQIILDQLYDFINVGHEIPPALREASKKIASTQADGKGGDDKKLPVYNSSVSGVSGAIQEDEEMEDSNLETKEEVAPPKPVAVSQYSKYDPRVPTQVDLPNSPYRIAMVCTLLEVVAPTIVSRNMLPRLKNFLVAFQRYLFTKAFLPTDVEFILLDTFDVLDSQWKRVSKSQRNAADGGESESGFPRYQTWLEAHNSTVAAEEAEALFEIQKRQRLEALADESKSLADMEGLSLNDDETGSMLDEDDDATLSVASGKESASEGIEEEEVDRDGETAGEVDEEGYELGASEDDEEEESEYGETEEEEEEDEFDEDAHMKQLEEEAFDRELRRVTMDALEKGKNASRKQVGDSMISGSQISRKKLGDPSKATDASAALSGKAGVSFQLLKKGNKGKVETKEIVVPVDTNLAMVATKQDDEAARERDEIKQRVLQYEGKMAEAEYSGGNVYLEQEKLQVIRNKPLSIEEIDKNFGTTGGTLIQPPDKKKSSQGQQGSRSASSSSASAGRGRGGRGGRGHGGRGPGRGRGGRSSTGGRTLYG